MLEEFFKQEGFILLLVLPLLTMGLLTDERRKGTLELLLTSPVRPIELTLGKFLAALALFAVMCVPTLPYFYFLAQGGAWEPGVVLAGYVGPAAAGGDARLRSACSSRRCARTCWSRRSAPTACSSR